MGTKFIHGITFLLFLVAIFSVKVEAFDHDVKKFGAKGDGKTDDTKAFIKAWKKACNFIEDNNYLIPEGEYLVGPLKFVGPCQAKVTFRVKGNVAQNDNPKRARNNEVSEHNAWIAFQSLNKLSILGEGGYFTGRGLYYNCEVARQCESPPINLYFLGVYNAHIKNLESASSRSFHFGIFESNNVTFENVTITKPGKDGFYIQESTDVNITTAEIEAKDSNCVTIKDGNSGINVQNMTCKEGTGLGVGIIGKTPNEKPVMGVTVKNCTFSKTVGGIRIVSWLGSQADIVLSNLVFEDIEMDQTTGTPLIINQEYCQGSPESCRKATPSKVSILEAKFKNIRGAANLPEVVDFVCSNAADACKDVELSNINLTYAGKDGKPKFKCTNVKPVVSGKGSASACELPNGTSD